MVTLLAPNGSTELLAAERPPGTAGLGETTSVNAPGSRLGIGALSMRADGAAVAWWPEGYAVRPPGGPFGAQQPLPDPRPSSDINTQVRVGPSGEVLALRTGAGNGLEAAAAPEGTPLPTWEHRADGFFLADATFDPDGTAVVMSIGLDPSTRALQSIPVVIIGEREADGTWTPFRRVSPPRRRISFPPRLEANSSGAAVVSWTLRGTVHSSPAAQIALRPGASAQFSKPEALPLELGPDARAAIDDQGQLFAWGLEQGVVRAAERTRVAPDAVELSVRQLLINQRIAQAALRRASAINARLRAGLTGADIRPGALSRAVFGPGVEVLGEDTGAFLPARRERPLVVPGRSTSSRGTVRLTARQLLINQRIAQAAVRRANRLTALFAGELTGAQIADGTLGPENLAPGLSIARTTALAAPAAVATAAAPAPAGAGARVGLSATQLRISQRIAQAALRRLNAVRMTLEHGVPGSSFAPGSITAVDLRSDH